MSSHSQLTQLFFFIVSLCCSWIFSATSNCWATRLQNCSRYLSLKTSCSSVSKTLCYPCFSWTDSICVTISSPVYSHSLFITELLVGTNNHRPYNANIFRHICTRGVAITWFCFRILAGSCPVGSTMVKQHGASLPALSHHQTVTDITGGHWPQ